MTAATDPFEIVAIRYARAERRRSAAFIGGDVHDGPQPMAYYVWLLRREGEAIVVDTGFDRETAAVRRREFIRCPGETLADLGVDPAMVRTVILLTHPFHHDHARQPQPSFPECLLQRARRRRWPYRHWPVDVPTRRCATGLRRRTT